MSKPGNAEALDDFPVDEEVEETSSPAEESFESKVNNALKSMTQGEDGKYNFPDDTPEEIRVAANAERRRRDTESALSKEKNKNSALQDKMQKVMEKVFADIKPTLTIEQAEELEDLKRDDPEAWRKKMNELEEDAREKALEEFDLSDEEEQVLDEVSRRAEVLSQFLEDNPGLVLNDEVMENDLPPRLVKQLEKAEITFEEFLDKAKEHIEPTGKGTKIKTKEEKPEPNLGKAGGGTMAEKTAVATDIVKSYNKEIF